MELAALAQQFSDAQPPPAANPTPTSAALAPSHPSYLEMISAAIQWGSSQGKEGGSSKRAISKYIDRVYTNLPPSHSALLTHHLKRLKNAGILVMVKNSYQLSSALPQSAPIPGSNSAADFAAGFVPSGSMPVPDDFGAKRGPGRPPKLKPVIAVSSEPAADNGSGFMSEPGKKRRGRPPKLQQGAVATEVPFVEPISEVQPSVVNGDAMAMAMAPSVQRKRGRPPKEPRPLSEVHPANEEVMAKSVVPKKRPGRPPKESVAGTVGNGRGRPRKNEGLDPVSSHAGKRPRGRPRKIGGGVGIRVVQGKRGGSSANMAVRRTGRPVGRPRKDGSLKTHTSDQERIANEELMRKFELIQSKIRETVVKIRPYVANENAALTALQQLEELTAVDLNAPPPPLPPLPPPPSTTMMMRPENISAPPNPAVPVSSINPDTTLPTPNVTAPFMAAPPPFNVTMSGMEEGQPRHPMSWFPSNE